VNIPSSIKATLIMIASGIVVGIILGFAFAGLLYEHQADVQSTATLDNLIAQWTIERSPIEYDHASLELPDAKPGYIPDTVFSLARIIDSLYHVPKGVTVAQWILESRWGMNDLRASNYFGHTYNAVRRFMDAPDFTIARERAVKSGIITWGDSVRFARYNNIRACFDTHGRYLSRSERFKSAFMQNSQENFALLLTQYATDPDYGLKLVTIMKRYQL
jgi:hypothetical protein